MGGGGGGLTTISDVNATYDYDCDRSVVSGSKIRWVVGGGRGRGGGGMQSYT